MTKQQQFLNIFETKIDADNDVVDLYSLKVGDVVVNYELENGKKIDFKVKKLIDKDEPLLLIDVLKSNDSKVSPNKDYQFNGEVVE